MSASSSSSSSSDPSPSEYSKTLSSKVREAAINKADEVGRGVCCVTGLSIPEGNPGCSLRVISERGVPAAVPKAQFVSIEAALRFIGQVCQANPDSDKKEASALANLNRCGVDMSKERGTAVIKIAEKAGLFVGDCGNSLLKAAREKYDADCKEKGDAAKEKEKQEKLAAKEKEKQVKAAEKEKEKSAKRKIDEVEAASAEPVAAPKAKRVRKEKAAPKAREALGLDADQVIGTQVDEEWGMAQ